MRNVYLFVPNILGYVRILLLLVFMVLAVRGWHFVAIFCYAISCLLDALDGTAARRLNQTSKFGAVLDMVTDRSSTTVLTMFLGFGYPRHLLFFQLMIVLDWTSHYMHMNSSLLRASSHKAIKPNAPKILKSYYESRLVLFTVCALNELFYIALYLYLFLQHSLVLVALCASLPVFILKQAINVVQIITASDDLSAADSQTH